MGPPPHRRPKKPERNPSHIVFTEDGRVSHATEGLPRYTDPLALTIGQKFLHSLSARHAMCLTDLRVAGKNEEPADLVCADPDGSTVMLQLVEGVNEAKRRRDEMRHSYLAAVKAELADRVHHLDGYHVSITDDMDSPTLPKVSTPDGQKCLQAIVDQIQAIGTTVDRLPTAPDSRLNTTATLCGWPFKTTMARTPQQ